MFRVGRWFDKVDRNHNPQNVRRASGHLVVLLVIREYLQTTRGGGGVGTTGPGSAPALWRRQLQLSG